MRQISFQEYSWRNAASSLVILLLMPFLMACSDKGDNSDYHFPYEPDAGETDNNEYTQPGEWTEEEVMEGVIWHSFKGVEEITNASQIINVLEVDLNNPRYKVDFYYYGPNGVTLPDAMKEFPGAIGGLNAAYELSSVYIKTDGIVHFQELTSTLMSTGIANWKNEGAVCLDDDRDISFMYLRGKSLAEQKAAFQASTSANIFSSAAMLVWDSENVGETFVNTQDMTQEELESSFNAEDPIRHQGGTNPRSAIGLTEDNHLLLIAVDGRRTDISTGMSVGDLAQVLIEKFHPEYALNMDGGGSTTLCVKDRGDANTNIVNYPTDNGQFDHGGARRVSTFFIVTDTQSANN